MSCVIYCLHCCSFSSIPSNSFFFWFSHQKWQVWLDVDSIRMMTYDAIFGLLFQEMSNFQDHKLIIFWSYSGTSLQQPCSSLYLGSTSSSEKSTHATYAEADSILRSKTSSEAVPGASCFVYKPRLIFRCRKVILRIDFSNIMILSHGCRLLCRLLNFFQVILSGFYGQSPPPSRLPTCLPTRACGLSKCQKIDRRL